MTTQSKHWYKQINHLEEEYINIKIKAEPKPAIIIGYL